MNGGLLPGRSRKDEDVMKKKVAISAIVLCLAVSSVVFFLSAGQASLEAYWNDRGNLVFERSSARPEISDILVKDGNGGFCGVH